MRFIVARWSEMRHYPVCSDAQFHADGLEVIMGKDAHATAARGTLALQRVGTSGSLVRSISKRTREPRVPTFGILLESPKGGASR